MTQRRVGWKCGGELFLFFFFSEFVPTQPSVASNSSDMDYASSLYEKQSLDQFACAMGGHAILPPCVPGTIFRDFSSFLCL